MRLHFFTAGIRGIITRLHHAPRISGLLGGALILLGLNGTVGVTIATTTNAFASSGYCTTHPDYALPTTLSLANAAPGVTVQNDGATNYGVGGTSVDAVRSALNTCAPTFHGASKTDEYLAYTSYAINWQYDTRAVDTTTCELTNIKVGLHLSQLMPTLSTESEASPSVQTKWNTFISGLATHENGHAAIDVAQANSLYASLQNLRGPCTTITTEANSITNAALISIISANADHDTVTDYGRDQGATW